MQNVSSKYCKLGRIDNEYGSAAAPLYSQKNRTQKQEEMSMTRTTKKIDEAGRDPSFISEKEARKTLDAVRRKLLDLSLRNKLLNAHIHSATGKQFLKFSGVNLTELIKTLEAGKDLSFTGIPEPKLEEAMRYGFSEVPPAKDWAQLLKIPTWYEPNESQKSPLQKSDIFEIINAFAREAAAQKSLSLSSFVDKKLCSAKYDPEKVSRVLLFYGFKNIADYCKRSKKAPASICSLEKERTSKPNQLRALLYPKPLDGYLKTIYRVYRSALDELGVGTLYLILGFIEWKEADSSSKVYFAPLVTYPVDMQAKRSKQEGVLYEYTLSASNEEPQHNLSLEEKFKSDFNVELPERMYDDEGNAESLEDYFVRVEKAISKKVGWKLHRYVVLGNLDFAKLMMYRDLLPESWPNGIESFYSSPFLSFLFKNKVKSSSELLEQDYQIDKIDSLETDVPLIDKADSSQHSALIDALKNEKSLVIEGPPGTGKSQTITNLIAGALSKGQTVLFVSEKTAALEVVKRRLDAAGLGNFCLSLQTSGVNKHKVMEDLKARIDAKIPPVATASLSRAIKSYRTIRDKLNLYAELINEKWGNTDKTIHEIFCAQVRYFSHFGRKESGNKISQINGLNFTVEEQEKYQQHIELILKITRTLRKECGVDDLAKCNWYGARVRNASTNYQANKVLDALSQWQGNLCTQKAIIEETAQHLGLPAEEAEIIEPLRKDLPSITQGVDFEEASKVLTEHKDFAGSQKYLIQLTEISKAYAFLEKTIRPEVLCSLEELKQNQLLTLQTVGSADDRLEDSPQSVLKSLSSFKDALEITAELEKNLAYFRANLPEELSKRLGANFEGYQFLERFLQVTSQLKEELVEHRRDFFDTNKADEEINHLQSSVEWLRRTENELKESFNIEKAMLLEGLSDIETQIKNRSIFSWFSSDFRSARAKLLSISSGSGKTIDELAELLPKLQEFKNKDKELNHNYGYSEKLGSLFKGRDSDLTEIFSIRNWYKAVRKEWGRGFGPNVAVGSALFSLPSSQFEAIQDHAERMLPRLSHALHSFKECQKIFPAISEEIQTGWEKGLISAFKLGEQLEDGVQKVASALLDPTTSEKDLREINAKIALFQSALKEIEKFENFYGLNSNKKLALTHSLDSEDGKKVQETLCFIEKISHIPNEKVRTAVVGITNRSAFIRLTEKMGKLTETIKEEPDLANLFFTAADAQKDQWLRESGDKNLSKIIARNQAALSHPEELRTWSRYMKLREEVEPMGILPMWDRLLSGEINEEQFSPLVYGTIFNTLADEICSSKNDLLSYTGVSAKHNQEIFKEKDSSLTELNKKSIAAKLMENSIPQGFQGRKVSSFTDLALVNHEITKKKQHIPLRRLFERAGDAILALKPCWMMSPLAVARFLTPGQITFDLIVMDEASQIRPEDALGTLLRGSQAVVVGDPKQLPPTSFFKKTASSITEEGDEEEEKSSFDDNESILDTMSDWLPKRMLRWHYRSRHESLIAFSNERFYHNELVLFPSPSLASDELGLRFTYIEDGEFNAGINRREAETIVDKILEHADKHPCESLAVVTMNAEQQHLVEDLLETHLIENPIEKEKIEALNRLPDPFIIKNLENIQGDERDVVFISCTYGKVPGTQIVRQNFGPINAADGWRRLNVLFTRARKRMHVFSSMRPEDIHPVETSTSYTSTSAFRGFLEKAQNQEAAISSHISQTSKEPDSDFEIAVAERLREAGFKVHFQVGAAGYFIDLAVLDPNDETRYIMAIECDGAYYHSAKSARDRDALRQQILENLGWKVRRIWSTDWFVNPDQTLKPIIEELRAIAKQSNASQPSDAANEESLEPCSGRSCCEGNRQRSFVAGRSSGAKTFRTKKRD